MVFHVLLNKRYFVIFDLYNQVDDLSNLCRISLLNLTIADCKNAFYNAFSNLLYQVTKRDYEA